MPKIVRLRQEQDVGSLFGSSRDGQPILLHLNDHWDTVPWLWSILLGKGLPFLCLALSNIDEHRQKYLQTSSSLLESPIHTKVPGPLL